MCYFLKKWYTIKRIDFAVFIWWMFSPASLCFWRIRKRRRILVEEKTKADNGRRRRFGLARYIWRISYGQSLKFQNFRIPAFPLKLFKPQTPSLYPLCPSPSIPPPSFFLISDADTKTQEKEEFAWLNRAEGQQKKITKYCPIWNKSFSKLVAH